MGNLLAEELQKYYSRKGNKLLFSNGMTLNQLALEMWEKEGCHGVDASVLSRVIKGERLFTMAELSTFAKLLHLGSKDLVRIETALSYDLNSRFGLDIDFVKRSDESLLALSGEILKKVRELKSKDLVMEADGFLDQVSGQLRERISASFDSQMRTSLEKLYAGFLIEKIYSSQVTKSRQDSFKSIIYLSGKLDQIGETLKDPVYVCIAKANIGDIYYINHSYKNSIKYMNEAMTYYKKSVIKFYPWTPLRPLALSYAHLGKDEEFKGVRDEILKIFPTLGIDAQCLALEGLAKGEAILGRAGRSEDFFVKGYRAHKKLKSLKGNFENLIRVLIIAGELESAKFLPASERQSSGYIEKIGQEGVRIAEQYGYRRHERKMRYLLNELLN